MLATVRANNLCMKLFEGWPFRQQLHYCQECQKPHHSLLHTVTRNDPAPSGQQDSPSAATPVQSHAMTGLLMTCQVMLVSPNGSSMKARALLDSASSTSFVSERLARSLHLPHSQHSARISGIAGPHGSPSHYVTNFVVHPWNNPTKQFGVWMELGLRWNTIKPQAPIIGQLPLECVTSGIIFEKVGVDYAGPVYLKLGCVCKPTIIKACSLSYWWKPSILS